MATPTWKGPTDQLVEANNSPTYELSERVLKTRIYHGLFSYCESLLPDYSRGTIGTGSEAGYLVSRTTLAKLRGKIGQLSIQWEASSDSSGQSLPSDEVAVTPNNLNPRLETHPRFTVGGSALTAANLANVETALRAQDESARATAYAALPSLGKELVDRIRRGNESYYLAALRYSWVTHSWTIPSSTRGGYVESPGGPLSSYFVAGISWLREADDLQYQNGIWRRTRTWLGGPNGYFDAALDT